MIVQTIDGIGRNEQERDLDGGEELCARAKRLMETWEIYPTKTNRKKAEEAVTKFETYIENVRAKYNV